MKQQVDLRLWFALSLLSLRGRRSLSIEENTLNHCPGRQRIWVFPYGKKECKTMKKHYAVLGSALALALPLAAQAETQGFYIGGAGGADFAINADASTGGGSNTVRYHTGPTGLITLGYGFGAFRTELEGSYRDNDVMGTRGAPLNGAGGDTQTWGAMVNGLYDFNTGTRFSPYVGAGIGVGFVHAALSGTRPAGSTVGLYDGSDTTFAYQAIGGVSYAVTPNLSLTTDYRYFATTDATVKSGGAEWEVENSSHVVTVGFRWSFGAPARPAAVPVADVMPPAPAPMAAPAEPTQYMVYFDWNKSHLTADAHAVIAQAAAAAKQSRVTVVLVTGNTDTSGSNAYNQKLSERRAAAVKRDLIRQGITANLIQTVGKGETDLAVDTGNNMREARNRRALIILRIG
jgi:outer membrane protein OmpA-like peptidoglycan-associated protein